MTIAPLWRTRLVAAAATVLALWLGTSVAQGELTLPVICIGVFAALIVVAIQPLPLETVLLGGAVVGYIVGNRGFAQLSLAGRIPLLPAEFVLMTAGAILLVRSAQEREIPFRRDALNFAILLWMVLSSIRVLPDAREFGFIAIRDYATIYYGAFFFLGQETGRTPAGRKFLWACTAFGTAALLVVYPVYLKFSDFFLGTLTVRGIPLIYFKGDLAGTFMAVGAVFFFARYEARRTWWTLLLGLALAGATVASNNRASMLGLAVASGLLLLARRWRFAAAQLAAGLVAAVVILFVAYYKNEPWQQTPLGGVYERVVSLVDPMGQRTYAAPDASNKGDNNLFRAVWWRAVFDETVDHNPWLGLGFGYDLAERFIREYYPESGDEFSTRSPHSILLTAFARTGLVGLLPLLGVVGIMVVRAVRTARRDVEAGGWWAGASAIFVSACFGVVLEGPMGAVVFWTLLGAANAVAVAPAERTEPIADPHLRAATPADELTATP